MKYPKISIVIPTFNQGQFIEETILSIVSQNYPSLELLIMDGGSTDGTIDIIKKYDKQIDFWRSERDAGQTEAIINGLIMASGDILGWVNSDDLLLKKSLYKIAGAYKDKPESGFFGGDCIYIDEQGFIIRVKKLTPHAEWFVRRGRGVISPDWFFTREAYNQVGGLNPELHYVMDTDLLFRMVREGMKFTYIPQPIVAFRIHPRAKTVSQRDAVHQEWITLFSRYKKDIHSFFPIRSLKWIYRVMQLFNGNFILRFLQSSRYRGKHWKEFEMKELF